jgi:hypothetical protein
MEDEKNKIKEPFTPENTPNPPQIIDPNKRNDEPTEKNPMKTSKGPASEKTERANQKPAEPRKEEKLLGESETEITDETTI